MGDNELTKRIKLEAGGAQLEGFEAGEGSPVLFLHGMSGAHRSHEVIAGLGTRRHVLAPNLPGYGGSPRPQDCDRIDDLAFLILDLVRDIGRREGPLLIVGCSIGAWVAAEASAMCTEYVAGLVLSTPLGIKVSGILDMDVLDLNAHSPEIVAQAMHHDPLFDEGDLSALSDDELTARFQGLESTALYGWKPYMHNPKLHGRLGRIEVPALIIGGASDGVLSPKIPVAYSDAIPGANLALIQAAGHEPEREQPESFSRVVNDFAEVVFAEHH